MSRGLKAGFAHGRVLNALIIGVVDGTSEVEEVANGCSIKFGGSERTLGR
jgi:hypothetical protein